MPDSVCFALSFIPYRILAWHEYFVLGKITNYRNNRIVYHNLPSHLDQDDNEM